MSLLGELCFLIPVWVVLRNQAQDHYISTIREFLFSSAKIYISPFPYERSTDTFALQVEELSIWSFSVIATLKVFQVSVCEENGTTDI